METVGVATAATAMSGMATASGGSGTPMSDHGSNGPAGNRAGEPSSRGRPPEEAVVTVYEDGPLIVRGGFTLAAQDGRPIPAGRRTVALCRCGRSANKPFCDGAHARTGFRAPGGAQGARPAAQDRDRGGAARPPLASVTDTAADGARQREPSAD